MVDLTLSGIARTFGTVEVLDDINLDVRLGGKMQVDGPSLFRLFDRMATKRKILSMRFGTRIPDHGAGFWISL